MLPQDSRYYTSQAPGDLEWVVLHQTLKVTKTQSTNYPSQIEHLNTHLKQNKKKIKYLLVNTRKENVNYHM